MHCKLFSWTKLHTYSGWNQITGLSDASNLPGRRCAWATVRGDQGAPEKARPLFLEKFGRWGNHLPQNIEYYDGLYIFSASSACCNWSCLYLHVGIRYSNVYADFCSCCPSSVYQFSYGCLYFLISLVTSHSPDHRHKRYHSPVHLHKK